MRATFALPGVRAWWEPQRDSYSESFRDFLEQNPLVVTNAPTHLAMQQDRYEAGMSIQNPTSTS
jgi:hypothetical protein